MLFQDTGHPVLHVEAESAAHTEKREDDAMLLHSHRFLNSSLLHVLQVGVLSPLPEPELGDSRQDGGFPERHPVEQAAGLDPQLAILHGDLHLRGIKSKPFQEIDVGGWQVGHLFSYEELLLTGE